MINCNYYKKYYDNISKDICVECGNDFINGSDKLCHSCRHNDKEDIINKPNHYHEGGIDPIGLGEKIFTEEEMLGFYKMNVLKYRMRAGKKNGNSEKQDLLKAEFYEKKIKEVCNARIHDRRK